MKANIEEAIQELLTSIGRLQKLPPTWLKDLEQDTLEALEQATNRIEEIIFASEP
jgi:hypothetical protein